MEKMSKTSHISETYALIQVSESFLSEKLSVFDLLRKLKTAFRSCRSQSQHLHGRLPKVAKLFAKALSRQDVVKGHDNNVFV